MQDANFVPVNAKTSVEDLCNRNVSAPAYLVLFACIRGGNWVVKLHAMT